VTGAGARIGKDVPMDLEQLTAYLAARVDLSRDPLTVVIQAARDADYARVAGVMQACRSARIEEIGLATRPVGEGP
jgi:biopolymer transport protein ExbD